MPDLRRRRHEQTKSEIVAVALRLFEEHGYANVGMEHVADKAGVSRSTLYRRFPTREHIILEVLQRWFGAWDACLATFDTHASAIDILEACSRAVADHIDSAEREVRIAYTARTIAPVLATHPTALQAWIERITALLDIDPNAQHLDTDAKHIIAGAYMGAINEMMERWVTAPHPTTVATLIEPLLRRLRPIWPGSGGASDHRTR